MRRGSSARADEDAAVAHEMQRLAEENERLRDAQVLTLGTLSIHAGYSEYSRWGTGAQGDATGRLVGQPAAASPLLARAQSRACRAFGNWASLASLSLCFFPFSRGQAALEETLKKSDAAVRIRCAHASDGAAPIRAIDGCARPQVRILRSKLSLETQQLEGATEQVSEALNYGADRLGCARAVGRMDGWDLGRRHAGARGAVAASPACDVARRPPALQGASRFARRCACIRICVPEGAQARNGAVALAVGGDTQKPSAAAACGWGRPPAPLHFPPPARSARAGAAPARRGFLRSVKLLKFRCAAPARCGCSAA